MDYKKFYKISTTQPDKKVIDYLISEIDKQEESILSLRLLLKEYKTSILALQLSNGELKDKEAYENYYNRRLKKGHVTFDHRSGIKFDE